MDAWPDADDLVYVDACDGCFQHISWVDTAYICTHECTWCPACAEQQGMVCTNCSGELRPRPRRTRRIGR